MGSNTIYTYIIDDHPMVLDAISYLIEDEPDMEVCGKALSSEEFLHDYNQRTMPQPVVYIVDLFLREGSGFDLIRFLRFQDFDHKILACSMYDKELVNEHAFRCGADGFISKRELRTKLVDAIYCIQLGEPYLDRQMLKSQYHYDQQTSQPQTLDNLECLSIREFEIFHMIGLGENTSNIANILHLDIDTVFGHCKNIQQKLGLTHINDLIRHSIAWAQF